MEKQLQEEKNAREVLEKEVAELKDIKEKLLSHQIKI